MVFHLELSSEVLFGTIACAALFASAREVAALTSTKNLKEIQSVSMTFVIALHELKLVIKRLIKFRK